MGDDDDILQWETEHLRSIDPILCILAKNLQGGGQMGALSFFSPNDSVGMVQIRVQIMDDNWMTDVKLLHESWQNKDSNYKMIWTSGRLQIISSIV